MYYALSFIGGGVIGAVAVAVYGSKVAAKLKAEIDALKAKLP